MPSSTLLPEHKTAIKRALPDSTQKIITATVARLYVAYPDPNQWTYARIMGGLAFVRTKDSFFFRIVDLMADRGVIWEQELYENFEYTQERSFFHTFALDNCLAAFSFADEQEASTFFKKVSNRNTPKESKKSKKSSGTKSSGFFGSKKSKGKVDKTQIGLPSDFRHVSHVGWDPNKGFDSHNVGPEWENVCEQLDKMGVSIEQLNKVGVSQKDIQDNPDIVNQFVASHGGPGAAKKRPAAATHTNRAPPTAPVPRAKHQRSPSAGSIPSPSTPPVTKRPQPPPPTASRRAPPPPPPPRRAGAAPSPAPSSPGPPALPSREPVSSYRRVPSPPSPEPTPSIAPPTPARNVQAAVTTAPPPPPRPSYAPPSSNQAPPPPPPRTPHGSA
ncbi:hypothetical protein BGZ65_010274, partial [Modicella reniformis]